MEIKVLSDDIVTVPEAAKRLGKPKMTLYRWIDADKIVSIKLGGILFIPISEIERLSKPGDKSEPKAKRKPVKESEPKNWSNPGSRSEPL